MRNAFINTVLDACAQREDLVTDEHKQKALEELL